MSAAEERLALAKAIPILEVAHRLGISGLRPAGLERVGPCPVCGDGGKRTADRFGINPAKGLFLCRQCGGKGDGVALVQHVQGCDFKAALDFLVGGVAAPIDQAEIARRRKAAEEADRRRQEYEAQARARAIRDAREIWQAAEPGKGTAAEAYLAGRGIRFPEWPPTLRYLPAHRYGRPKDSDYAGPCMIAAVQNQAGKVAAVHQTWIDPANPGRKAALVDRQGEALPAKLVRGSKKGGAIRLSPLGSSGVLVMGEGIETTASALTINAIPTAAYWAGVDLGNMAGRQLRVPGAKHSGLPDMTDDRAWLPPAEVSRLVFIQDGDSDPEATRAKLLAGLRRAAAARPGLVAQIVAAAPGCDLNDMITN